MSENADILKTSILFTTHTFIWTKQRRMSAKKEEKEEEAKRAVE